MSSLAFQIYIMKTIKVCSWLAAGASVIALTMAFPSSADQAASAVKPDKSYTGMVKAIDPKERTLEVSGLIWSKKFSLGDNCAYVQWDKSAGAMGDLRPGEKVTVSYQENQGVGVLVADNVKQVPMTEKGTVQSIDPKARTITLNPGPEERTLQLPADCTVVLHGGKEGTLANIQTGNHVIVTYELPNRLPTVREIAQTSETFKGDLTSIDPNQKMLQAKAMFSTKKFVMSGDCAIVVNGKPGGKLTDLKVGENLSISYDDVNGVNVANRIAPTEAVPAGQELATRSMQR
jgi:Cu/Ag efflux protein CusF